MNDIDIDAVRQREQVILPGPWRVGEPTPTGPDLWELPILLDRAGPDGPEAIQVCAVEYQTGGFHYPHADAKADAEFIAHARTDVPALLAKVDELTAERDAACSLSVELLRDKRHLDDLSAALAQSREQAATYANEIGSLKAELERVKAAFGDARAELSERYAERDRLRSQLAEQQPVITAVKKWRESDDVQTVGLDEEGMALVDAYDAYEIDASEAATR